ncbi:isochorismatase family protein [uncultured Amnibacterium sp.]|uniref:isochorismatase family protein n=1 Tax=uncultured Amnibacterium sp. TaxID=1631851 RepID=UPI0035C9AB4B
MSDRPTRALIVIDVQREYVDGNLPIGFPPLDVCLPNIAAAIDAAHEASIPVVLVQHVDAADSPVFAEGSRGAELHDTVSGAAPDLLLTKETVSCFGSGELAPWLEEHGIDTLTIAGFMTQHCDESTARDAADLGLAVELLADASGTLPLETPAGTLSARQVHERTLIVLASGFASVATTAAWISAVQADTPLPEPDLWASTEPARA